MKVAFFEYQNPDKEYLKNKLGDFELSFFSERLSLQNVDLVKDTDAIVIFIESEIDGAILKKLPNLKMITTRSTGFDHIDLEACKKRNVVVCNVPHYGDNTVAEHTFALLLDLSRKIHHSIESVKKEGFSIKGLTGFDLKGRTLGVIGTGRIGSHVVRIAKGFEMNVLAYDVNQNTALAHEFGFEYITLEELLKKSDIITLHTPYNKKTHHLINRNNIGFMKRGAYIINTARGALIETEALVRALDEGILAGAGLDVLEEENAIKEESQFLLEGFLKEHNLKTILEDHLLMERDNVIITPHNAFNSKEALERILEITVENIKGFGEGQVVNTVT